MIVGFKHSCLRHFYENNDRRGINPEYVEKVKKILSMLDIAETAEEMDIIHSVFMPLLAIGKELILLPFALIGVLPSDLKMVMR